MRISTFKNEGGGQIVSGIRVKGLGKENIDLSSVKKYTLPSSKEGGFPSIDVDPKGAVIVSLRQTNVRGTSLDQIQNHERGWSMFWKMDLQTISFPENASSL